MQGDRHSSDMALASQRIGVLPAYHIVFIKFPERTPETLGLRL